MTYAQRGGGKKIPQICGQTVHKIWTKVKSGKSEIFADVIYGSPLTTVTTYAAFCRF